MKILLFLLLLTTNAYATNLSDLFIDGRAVYWEVDNMEYATDNAAQDAYISSDTVPSPISQWKMNDDAGNTTVVDSVGDNDGTYSENTDTGSVTGKINDALDFDGVDDRIVVPNTSSLQTNGDMTISLWYKIDDNNYATDEKYVFLSKGYNDEYEWLIYDNSFRLFHGDGTNFESAFIHGTPTTDVWQHIVLVRDSSSKEVTVYLDNEEVNTESYSLDVATSAEDIGIGARNGGSREFPGLLDDVRIYDYALTAGQVAGLYANGNGTEKENPPINLVSYSEDTITQQGSYSLKGIATTDALNDTLTKTTTLDLSNSQGIEYDIRASRTGSNIKIGLRNLDQGFIPGLISQWKMNDDAGNTTVVDSVGSNDGTYTNAGNTSTGSVTGKINDALDFDGSNDYVDVPSYSTANSESVSAFAWIKADSFQEYTGVLSNSNGAGGWDGWIFYVDGNILGTYLNSHRKDTTTLFTNTWYHIGFTYDGNELNLYIDGIVEKTDTSVSYIGEDDLAIGTFDNDGVVGGNNNLFNGQIDDVRIYDRALTSDEIDILYNSGDGTEEIGETTIEHTANVSSANTNQTESWDISGISDANKDDIDEVIITIENDDAENTFYIDDLKWGIDAAYGDGSW